VAEGSARSELARRLAEAFRAVALAVVSLAACALTLEVGLRLAWTGYYRKFNPDRPFSEFDFHPTRGYTPGPNVTWYDATREYRIWLRHNSLGFRGPEIAPAKPPGRTRILVLGDSQTYGTGVENDETFCAALESLDPSLQVINAGVGGYASDQELLMLRDWIEPLDPDVVILAYFWNDLFEVTGSDYTRAELSEGRVRFVPPEPATIEHPSFAGALAEHEKLRSRYGWLRRESYLYRFVSDRYKVLNYAIRDWLGDDRAPFEVPFRLEPDQVAAAWALSEALLREAADLSHRHGADFVLMVIPDQVQVEPDVVVYGVPGWLLGTQDRVRSFAEREGIPFIDPTAAMHEIRLRDGVPLYHRLDRHLNRVGHRHVAELLRAELDRLGMLPKPVAPAP
jgi:lysophospholipase L1-like esterase